MTAPRGSRATTRHNDAADFAGMTVRSASAAKPSRAAVATKFLRTLVPEMPEGMFMYIWTLRDRVSAYFSTVAEAGAYAASCATDSDTYFGMALTGRRFEPGQRIKISEGRLPAASFTMWADFDFRGPAHQKTNLLRDLDDVRPLLPIPPSMIVLTGHGAHCYWIFREPWVFDSETEMKQAAALAARWNRAIQARAARQGWSVDSVYDLSRVLRVAGTLNHKVPSNVREVVVIEHDPERRYNPSEIADALDVEGAPMLTYADITAPEGVAVALPAKYNPAATAPRHKLELLLEGDPIFRLTWQHRRLDMLDQSASAYDLALANALALVKWTDAEIIDALIERRRLHGEVNMSKYRDSYFGPTIRRARQNAARFWGEAKP